MDGVLIHDELLAEALDLPRDRHSIDHALSRPEPDPFENFWAELRALTRDVT